MENRKIRVGISHGDINGIAYEVILKTFNDPKMLELCTPVLYGSSKVLLFYKKELGFSEFNFNVVRNAAEVHPNKFNLINVVEEDVPVEPGLVTAIAGKLALVSLEGAVEDLQKGLIDVLVTAPINKKNIQSSTFYFPGHTEYLERCAGEEANALMVLACRNTRIAVVTGHVPLLQLPQLLTQEKIFSSLMQFNASLKKDFRVRKPRIAVLSLNPHAGECGLFGEEETQIISPAMEEAQQKGVLCFGPYPADGFFGSGNYSKFDGVLAMYHDQGLIPFKTLSMEEGVNFTAGLPFVRTSPVHGTAYDLMGTHQASASSFREAIYMAMDIVAHRKFHKEITANPLKKQFYEKGNDSEVLNLSEE